MNYDETRRARKSALDQIAQLNVEGFRSQQYSDALKSPEWKSARLKVLKRDGYLCQFCLEHEAIDAHHLSYRYGMIPPMIYLRSVCRECHDRFHRGWWGWPLEAANDNGTTDKPLRQYALSLTQRSAAQ